MDRRLLAAFNGSTVVTASLIWLWLRRCDTEDDARHEHQHDHHSAAVQSVGGCREHPHPEDCKCGQPVVHTHVHGHSEHHAEAAPAMKKARPPPLGSVIQLSKETGRPRPECKEALMANGNDYEAAKLALMPEAAATPVCAGPGVAVDGFVPATSFLSGGSARVCLPARRLGRGLLPGLGRSRSAKGHRQRRGDPHDAGASACDSAAACEGRLMLRHGACRASRVTRAAGSPPGFA